MARSKWTDKELKEIWAQGIKCFPDPKPGEKYGYSDAFLPVAINKYSVRERFKDRSIWERTHNHRQTVDLLWGGVGSGKSCHSVALGLEYSFAYPGCKGLVGGRVYKDLFQNVISMYRDRLTINEPWDHPAVKKHPSEDGHNKILVIEPYPGAKWSEIEFFQFEEWLRVRGRNRDWVHFEEISQLQDVSIIDELPRRCRGTLLPTSHIFCTTNPPESTSHWIYPKWNIYQHMKSYSDEIGPIGHPCKCQFCQDCLNRDLGEFLFDENGFCPNPECPTRYRKAKRDANNNIVELGPSTEREYYYMKYKGKDIKLSCPGGEYFWRVLFSSAVDNPHVRADFIQSQSNSDSRVNALYVKGEPMELNQANAYGSFTYLNIRDKDKDVDYNKDIFWSFDFNNRPQCSAICQETYKDNGELDYVEQVDEIILFDIKEIFDKVNPKTGERERGASPEHIAAEFMRRYPNFPNTIYMYGDPTAVNKTSGPLEVTKYQIIYNILTAAGYKVAMMVVKQKGVKRIIPIADRVNNANWIFKDNKGTVRFYISPKCKYTITSLKDLKWDKSGENIEKRLIDEYARRTTEVIFPEDVYKYVRFVSHPADALTYYLYQKFPLIKDPQAANFLTIPGQSTFMLKDGKISEEESPLIKEEEERRKRLKENSITSQETLADTLRNILGSNDLFDDGNSLSDFTSYFS